MDSKNIFQEEVPSDSLEVVSKKVKYLRTLTKEIALLEEKLKKKKGEAETVSREEIPSLLNPLSISEIKLDTGERIIIEDKVKSSITKGNSLLAYRNMVEAEGGGEIGKRKVDDLFKSKTIMDEPSDELIDYLLDHDIPFEVERNIHYQTLNKYCRSKLDRGEPIPEGISVFQYQETKIK